MKSLIFLSVLLFFIGCTENRVSKIISTASNGEQIDSALQYTTNLAMALSDSSVSLWIWTNIDQNQKYYEGKTFSYASIVELGTGGTYGIGDDNYDHRVSQLRIRWRFNDGSERNIIVNILTFDCYISDPLN